MRFVYNRVAKCTAVSFAAALRSGADRGADNCSLLPNQGRTAYLMMCLRTRAKEFQEICYLSGAFAF